MNNYCRRDLDWWIWNLRVLDMPGKAAMGKIKIAHSVSAPLKSSRINHRGWFRGAFISLRYYCHTGAICLLIKLFLRFLISLLQYLHYDFFNDLSVNMKPGYTLYLVNMSIARREEFSAFGSTQYYVEKLCTGKFFWVFLSLAFISHKFSLPPSLKHSRLGFTVIDNVILKQRYTFS